MKPTLIIDGCIVEYETEDELIREGNVLISCGVPVRRIDR